MNRLEKLEGLEKAWADRRATNEGLRQKMNKMENDKRKKSLPVHETWNVIQKSICSVIGQIFSPKKQEKEKVSISKSQFQVQNHESNGRNRLASRLNEYHRLAAVKAEIEFMKSSSISILPADYCFSTALTDLAHSSNHDRAFLLLDLAAVVSAHVDFHTMMSGTSMGLANRYKGFHERQRQKQQHQNIGCDNFVFIESQFDVLKNRDLQLLRLFLRMKVGLRCSSREDVNAVRKAMEMEYKEKRMRSKQSATTSIDENDKTKMYQDEIYKEMETLLLDDPSKPRKPDSFFKSLLQFESANLQSIPNLSNDDNSSHPFHSFDKELTIDGPEEIERLERVAKKFKERFQRQIQLKQYQIEQSQMMIPSYILKKFILRIPSQKIKVHSTDISSNDISPGLLSNYESLIINTSNTAKTHGGQLIGVSIDLSFVESLHRNHDVDLPSPEESCYVEKDLRNFCSFLRNIRLLFVCILNQPEIIFDFTSLPLPVTEPKAKMLALALAKHVDKQITNREAQVFLSKCTYNKKQSNDNVDGRVSLKDCAVRYTADVSLHLVAHAGGLCTRIIGVKKSYQGDKNINEKTNDNDFRNDLDSSNQTRLSEVDIHYFIDDGCYGSLSSTKTACDTNASNFLPMPLYGVRKKEDENSISLSKSNHSFNSLQSIKTTKLMNATVWGPTCDGLDQVCKSLLLPNDLEANRDWLIFPNLGCGGFGGGLGLGTAFNGFDAPDTVYCVLGYFTNWKSGINDSVRDEKKDMDK